MKQLDINNISIEMKRTTVDEIRFVLLEFFIDIGHVSDVDAIIGATFEDYMSIVSRLNKQIYSSNLEYVVISLDCQSWKDIRSLLNLALNGFGFIEEYMKLCPRRFENLSDSVMAIIIMIESHIESK